MAPALFVVAALLAAGCGGSDDDGAAVSEGGSGRGDPVKIALVVHETGPFAETGHMTKLGASLAVEEINAAGGIEALGGAPLELVVADAGASVEEAIRAANRVVADGGITAGIGTGVSSHTLAVTEIAERRRIPWLTVAFQDELTERGFKYTFATSPKTSEFTDLWVPAIVELAEASGIDLERVGIIAGTNIVAAETAKALRETYAEKYGWDIVLDQTVEDGSVQDATPLAQAIAGADPQLLLVGASLPDIAKISRKVVELGQRPVPWVLSGAPYLSGGFLQAMGADAVNGTLAVAASAIFSGQEELAEKVIAKGDQFPQQYHFVAYSHVYLIKEALEQAGSADPQEVRDALASLDVEGGPATVAWPSQRVRFDETGRAIDRQAVLVQWQGEDRVTVFPEELAQGDPIWPTFDTP